MKKMLPLAAALLLSCSAQASVVLVGNPSATALNKTQASKLFLGKMKKLPWGGKPMLVELQTGAPLRVEFHQKVTGKSEAQLQSYWSRLVFTGKASAPVQMADSAQVKQRIASHANAIGYIDEADLDGSVKLLYKP